MLLFSHLFIPGHLSVHIFKMQAFLHTSFRDFLQGYAETVHNYVGMINYVVLDVKTKVQLQTIG